MLRMESPRVGFDKQGLRVDEIGFGGLLLIQNPKAFCYGVDAVLLASFVDAAAKPEVIVDLGTGNGILPILLSHKTSAAKILGVELQQEAVALAEKSVVLNNLEQRIQIFHKDLKDVFDVLEKGSCDAVVTNPPYMKAQHGQTGTQTAKLIARHETTADLADFMETASKLLRPQGSFYLIHRPQRLVDILTLSREYRMEPKRIQLVSPEPTKSSNLVLVHCVKGGRPGLKWMDPLSVYDGAGNYTRELLELYERHETETPTTRRERKSTL